MKFDLKFALKDRQGKEVKDGDGVLMANELLATILDNPTEETKDPFKLLKVDKIIRDLFESGKIEVDSEDVSMIKKSIASFPIKVVLSAQLIEYLNKEKK